eukprot:CAMPEP_0194562638 /NCGR_PEP_ID=MMETSP0292-20121207/3009_1 /TAXON_ID=39354 /ORGANISM="Heterosigma akashiwo, Strain CCMP2393" /LENGTH=303 /DNA_ID=CAMNT_0039411399 /DNA_START=52 /DNA_END=959 /DNA_ORIENTATION=-
MDTPQATVPQHEEILDVNGKKFIGYLIRVYSGNDSWSVTKRYSDFLTLHTFLTVKKGIYPDIDKFDFPKKEFGWLALDEKITLKRKEAFDEYVMLLVGLKPIPAQVEAFLGFDGAEADPTELTRMDSNLTGTPTTMGKHHQRLSSLQEEEGEHEEEDEEENVVADHSANIKVEAVPGFGRRPGGGGGGEPPRAAAAAAPHPIGRGKTWTQALGGVRSTVMLVVVFAMLLLMADYLDDNENPRMGLLWSLLGLAAALVLAQPETRAGGRADLAALPVLAANGAAVFGGVYVALVLGQLQSAAGA